jgi:sugar lactone lactonase YvrE
VVALLGYLAAQNFYDYYTRYLGTYPGNEPTGQALFVHQMNEKALAEDRLTPMYYMAAPVLFWDYGTNRYLNHGTEGTDIGNMSDLLPLTDEGDRDVVFLLWDVNQQYIPVLRSYYPDGEEIPFNYSPDGKSNYLFTAYRIKREDLEARRYSVASYASPGRQPVERHEAGIGTTTPPPQGLSYPANATWVAGLVAPGYGLYRFQISGAHDATLVIDGREVLNVTKATRDPTAEVVLARGVHNVVLVGSLAGPDDKIELNWLSGDVNFNPIATKYLWVGSGRGLMGEVRPLGGPGSDLLEDPPADTPDAGSESAPVFHRRIDGFLGFHGTQASAFGGGPLLAVWSGQLDIREAGRYIFQVIANGDAVLLIDDQPVVSILGTESQSTNLQGEGTLSQGMHNFKLRYNWTGGNGVLEVYWTPPNGTTTLITSDVLRTDGGIWQPGTVSEPPFYQLPLGDEHEVTAIKPDRVIGGSGDLMRPRGVAVDGEGNIYVGDRGHHRVVVYSPDGELIHAWGNASPNPERPRRAEFNDITDLAVGDNGMVYVLDGKSHVLQLFDHEGIWKQGIEVGPLAMYNPDGIALGQDGGIYIADTGKNRVLKLPPNYDGTQQVMVFDGTLGSDGSPRPNSKLRECVDVVPIAANGEESLYAVDLTNRVVRFAPDGRLMQQWDVRVGATDGGSRMVASRDGKTLYLSDPEHGRLAALDLETGKARYFAGAVGQNEGLGQPSGIAIGPDGRVYVVDSARNNVKVYTLK